MKCLLTYIRVCGLHDVNSLEENFEKEKEVGRGLKIK